MLDIINFLSVEIFSGTSLVILVTNKEELANNNKNNSS